MPFSRRAAVVIVAGVVATCAIGATVTAVHRARTRSAQRMFADFRQCAIGAGLAPGESLSTRLIGIRAARDVDIVRDWPRRCAAWAAPIAESPWVASSDPKAAAAALRIRDALSPAGAGSSRIDESDLERVLEGAERSARGSWRRAQMCPRRLVRCRWSPPRRRCGGKHGPPPSPCWTAVRTT